MTISLKISSPSACVGCEHQPIAPDAWPCVSCCRAWDYVNLDRYQAEPPRELSALAVLVAEQLDLLGLPYDTTNETPAEMLAQRLIDAGYIAASSRFTWDVRRDHLAVFLAKQLSSLATGGAATHPLARGLSEAMGAEDDRFAQR